MLVRFEIERARRILREDFNEEPNAGEAEHYALGEAMQRLQDAYSEADFEMMATLHVAVGELMDEFTKASRIH